MGNRIAKHTYDKNPAFNNGLGNLVKSMYYVIDVCNYSPFGVTLKGRNFKKTGVSDKFRFGFNGMEADDEIKGDGNSYDFGARMLDPRLGRWFAIDPLVKFYPQNSPYSFSENDVISCIELEGLEKWKVINYRNQQGIIIKTTYELYKETEAVAGMTIGTGIVYQERKQMSNGPGSARTIYIDNINSTFKGFPNGNNHGDAMQTGMIARNNKLNSQMHTVNPEVAILNGMIPQGDDKPLALHTQTYDAKWNWNFPNDVSNQFAGTQEEIAKMDFYIQWVATLILNNPGLTLTVEGHTSTPESEDYNLKLSQQRADFVRTQILKNLPNGGVGYEERIKAIGYGETKPLVANDSDPDKSKEENEKNQNINRRTEITYQNNGTY